MTDSEFDLQHDPEDELPPIGGAAGAVPSAGSVDEVLGEQGGDVMDYLDVEHRKYGLNELNRVQAMGYFMPLLREIFGGGEPKTKLVFAMLHGLMIDDRVRWSRQELDEKYHWLREGHRNYLIHRLSNVGWLEYFRDRGVYMISDKGEALMRILSRFVLGRKLVENEGAALAEIEFSILLELDDLPDRLKFLRNRLMKHSIRAELALNSESAYRILEIYEQLKSAYRWAEQTRRTLDHLEVEDDDSEQWEGIRGVHDHLSKLHELISSMQLTLQDIQRKQIDIAHYGLTHLDIDRFLIHGSVDELSDMLCRHLNKIPHPFLVVEDNLFSEAADIVNRESTDDEGEGRGWDTEMGHAAADTEPQEARETNELVLDLNRAPREWKGIEYLVESVPWEVAAYRFSILTLMADLEARMKAAPDEAVYDPIVNVPVRIDFDKHNRQVDVRSGEETYTMTAGRIRRLDASADGDTVSNGSQEDDDKQDDHG